MSYILFSQTSTANGTRNQWAGSSPGQLGAGGPAVVGGELVNSVANSSFTETAISSPWGTDQAGSGNIAGYGDGALIQNGVRALYDLSDASAAADYQFNAVLQDALSNRSGNVLNATGAGQTTDNNANNRTLDDASGYAGKTLNIGMSDVNWNDIKNVEVFLSSAETGAAFETLTLRSFVDARVKIGNEPAGCRDAASQGGTFKVNILDAKRGQVEGAQSDMALKVTIDVWTNDRGWQNSFSNQGSAYGDSFDINYGSLAVAKGVSEFGLGAGKLVDATDKTFDGIGEVGNQQSAYNGDLTTLFTNMGLGNDSYDATNGVAVESIKNGLGVVTGTKTVDAELRTIDYVWGGSGNDLIKGGGGNDFLFGDFGEVTPGGIGQSADPAALSLKVGGGAGLIADGFAAWNVASVVSQIWQQNLGGSVLVANAGNWAQHFQVTPNYGVAGISGIGVGNHTGTGVSNGNTSTNPEINGLGPNADALGVKFAADMSGAKVGLGLFYVDDTKASGTVQNTETGFVTLRDNGVDVATYRFDADGTVTLASGGGFAVTLSGASDRWNGTNPGESMLDISATGSAVFDEIVFTAGPILNPTSGTFADYILTDICATVAAVEGNDTLVGGGGNDTLVGGGDQAKVTVLPPTELVVNGGFETEALVRDSRDGWYLTGGAPGAGPGFGWTASPTGRLIEIQKDSTGGLGAFEGRFKLELDSDGTGTSNPLVAQNLATVSGAQYTLTFSFAERQGLGDGSSDFNLFWGGKVIATFVNDEDGWGYQLPADSLESSPIVFMIDDLDDGSGGWSTVTVTGLIGGGSVGFENVAGQVNTYGAFIDAVSVKASTTILTVEGGDRLNPGDTNARDTIVFERGDGFDIVTGFDARAGNQADEDVIDLVGLTLGTSEVAIVNGQFGLLLNFTDSVSDNGDDGRMFLAGVTSGADILFI